MTKLEGLKAAYAAATPVEMIKADLWQQDAEVSEACRGVTVYYGERDSDDCISHAQILIEQDFDNLFDDSPDLFKFIVLAHNLMPQLLEAVELLKEVGDVRDMAELMNLWDHKIEPLLEELKWASKEP